MFEFIKKLRSSEKGRTLFKFLIYMSFFLLVLILAIATGATKTHNPGVASSREENSVEKEVEKKSLTYFEKQKRLFSSKHEFSYNYKGEKVINLYGESNAGYVDGFKETEEDLIHFIIEGDVVYQKKMNEREVIDDLYKDMDSNLFDLKNLFDKLNASSATIEDDGDVKTYTYKIDYVYKVITSRDSIDKIQITKEDSYYEFSFYY